MSGVAKGHGGSCPSPIINIVANCFLQLILRSYIQSVVRLERGRHYRSRKCCSVRITCTVAANIFFKCKFENFLMVVSTMCPHIKVAELNTLSDGKGITGIHIAICQ